MGGGGRGELKVAFFCCVAAAALLFMETRTALTSLPGAVGIMSSKREQYSTSEGSRKVGEEEGGVAGRVTMRKTKAAAAAAADQVGVEGGGRNAVMTMGPGSYPPRCAARCGRCRPCRAVHVAMPPGETPVTAEYYPEAWRCKCGDRLYVP